MADDFLARGITRRNWEPGAGVSPEEIPADALTRGCLRTEQNRLSLWRCSADPRSVEDVVAALASARHYLESMDLVWFPEELLQRFPLRDTPGTTPVRDMAARHVDVAELDGSRLMEVAGVVLRHVRRDSTCRSFPKQRVLDILVAAVAGERLPLEAIPHPDLRSKVEAAVRQRS